MAATKKIGLLFLCALAILTVFVPFVIGDPLVFAHEVVFPITTNPIENTVVLTQESFITTMMLKIGVTLPDIVYEISRYAVFVFYGIVCLDVLAILISLIFPKSFLTAIFRFITFLAGIVMLAICIVMLASGLGFLVGLDGPFLYNVKISGVIYIAAIFVFSVPLFVKNLSGAFARGKK